MAEAVAGLAVASSIITIIEVTAKVVRIGWGCFRTLKRPPKELGEVMSELMSLQGVLSTLHDHLSTLHDDHDLRKLSALEVLNQADGILATCTVVLQDVVDILEGLQKRKVASVIAAGTSGQRLLSAKSRLERLKGLLTLALSSDHLTLARGIKDYLPRAFAKLQDGQEKLHCELLNIDNYISKLSRASDEMTVRQKEKYQADRHHKTLCWLSTINFEANHINACRLQQPGTGLWLVEGRQFLEWVEQDRSTFWLNALPGAGKTILCSAVIQKLRSRSRPIVTNPKLPARSVIVYFYFDFRNSEQQHAQGMLSSLLHQLSDQLAVVPEEICGLWEKYKGKKSRPPPDELLNILNLVVREYFNKVYVVLDALDECSERQILLPILRQLMKDKCVSLFLTSRIEHDIQKSFSEYQIYSTSIESGVVATDVELFLNEHIKTIETLRDLSHALQKEIVLRLVEGAKGMFRWVVCQLDILKTLGRPKAIRAALQCLPPTLDESYNRILMNIQSEEEKEFLRRALQFIIFAARPMTLKEVAEAVVIEDGNTHLDLDDRFNNPAHLIKSMGSLLITTGGYLGLSHYSIQEYLQSPRISRSPASYFAMTRFKAEEEISQKCLTYLAYDDFAEGPCTTAAEFDQRLLDYPFLEYSANNWFIHTRETRTQQSVAHLFDGIWTTVKSPKYLTWFQTFCDRTIASKRTYDTYKMTNPSIVYYPSLWGLHVLLQRIVMNGADVNVQGGYYGQALQAAAIQKNRECFEILLDHGADVHAQGGYFGNALQASAFAGCEHMISALLEKGGSVATEGGAYGNALQAASRNGHLGAISVLLQAGADVNTRGGPLGYPLQAAASSGHELACQALIDKGALVNAQGGAFGNALQAASLNGRTRVVELLLRNWAEVNAQGGLYSTALLAACLNGHESVARLLLRSGAYVSSEQGVYTTALQAAAINGFTNVVALLLQFGADVNQQGGQYGNALQAAARNGHERVVHVLLTLSADVNQAGGYYGSALIAACRNGFMAVARMLLDFEADPNLQSGIYGNALQGAASSNHGAIVQLLLERGAEVNTVGGSFYTALHAAAHQGHEKIVETLLEAGADVRITGGKFGTALEAARANGQADMVAKLKRAEMKMIETMLGSAPTDTIEASKPACEAEMENIIPDQVRAEQKLPTQTHRNELRTELMAAISLSASSTTTF